MEVERNITKYENNKINSLKLEKCLNKIIMKEGFVTYDMCKEEISTNGGNFLGLLYEIDVKGKTANSDKEINIFIKKIQSDEIQWQLISVPDVYKKELFAYQELSRVFKELQEEAHVPLYDRFKMVKCYDESNTETIILDNLARKGYTTYHRMDVISLKFAEMAIAQLAKFHAMSFVIQEKRPGFFADKIKTIELPFNFDEDWDGYIRNLSEFTVEYLDCSVRSKIKKSLYGILCKFAEYLQDSNKYCCLCHGDFRPNNIMMKEINGEISEVIPIDYQLIQYGCPIFDFVYFIYASTDREFRKAHLTNLKDMYYETLCTFLQYFDMDLNIFLPRSTFENTYKECLDFGLIITVVHGPFLFSSEDDIPDITKDSLSTLHFNIDKKYKNRLQGAVEEFIEKGYL